MKKSADLIVINAKVYTVDSLFSVSEAFAVKDGLFCGTGSTKSILSSYSSDNILDAGGKAVYPGFIDAHCHFYNYGIGLGTVDLVGTRSFEEVIEKIRNHADIENQSWITGRGWDQNDWDSKEFPDRKQLDVLFPDKPVFLTRIDGHAVLINKKAIEISGISPETSVTGGEFITKNGQLTGILIDDAIEYVRKFIPSPGIKDIEESLLTAQEKCFEVGLTSVHDAGLGRIVIDVLDSLDRDEKLKIRIYAMLSPNKETLEKYMFRGEHRSSHLHIRSIKLFADGALGSRGARMTEPYSDDPGNSGLWTSSPEYLMQMCRLADSCGFQVNTHCIGDAANKEVLDIYSGFLDKNNDNRWRIEHAQVVSEEDFHKFGEFRIIPSIQTTHATSDMYWAEERLGKSRIKNAYAYKRLLEQNGWFANGSDFPVEDINPVYGFYAGISRKDGQHYPPEGFQMENAISRQEALKAMTIWAARASFEEKEKGSIEPGKLADFVICDRDIMTVPEDSIANTRIWKTYISGEMVFNSK